MSYTVSAPVENNQTGSNFTNTVTLTGVPLGATINVLIAYASGGSPIVSVTDGIAYSIVGSEVVTGSGFNVDVYELLNASSGSHAIVTTVTAVCPIYCASWYITGSGTHTGTAASALVAFPGTGANIISFPAITPTVAASIIFSAGCTNDSGNTLTAGNTPNAFTSVGLATAGNLAEYFVQGAAAAITPTAGQTVNDRVGVFTWAYAPGVTSNTATIAWVT
jgi:hypothetical protein